MNDKYIVYFISKTKKKMMSFIEKKLKEKGLSDLVPAYGNVLTALYDNGGKLSMQEIGKLIGKDKSTITPLVNKLEKLGYVKKVKCKEDKRVTYVVIVEKGKEIEYKFNEISGEVYAAAYKNFSEEEREVFLKLLKRLNENFD